MQNKIASNNYEDILLYSVFGLLLSGIFTVMVAVSDIHWIAPVIVQILLCYPIAELAFFSAVKTEINPEMISFRKPWRKYSLLKKRPDFNCILRSDEWDTVIFNHQKNSSSFYFFKNKKAIYLFKVSGSSAFEYQLKSMYYPEKTFVEHREFKSIDLMPELFEHFPESII